MSFNIDRALKRANKFLKISKDIINKYEEIKNNQKYIEWVISNCDLLQEEMDLFGYGRGVYVGTSKFINRFKRYLDFQYIKRLPFMITFSEEHNTDDVIRLSKRINEHLLKYIQKLKEKNEDEESLNRELKESIKQLNPDLIVTHYGYYLENTKEANIFLNNLKSLKKFEHDSNYKYCMIAMGSILEFLLERYCKRKKINPEPFNNQQGKTFANYVEAGIKNEIFGDKKYWELVQTHLRDFRNYIHIPKEVKNPEIDFNWYKIIKPAFEHLLKNFQKVSGQELS